MNIIKDIFDVLKKYEDDESFCELCENSDFLSSIKPVIYMSFETNLKVCFYKRNSRILHKKDGPAVIYFNGHKEWYLNGLRHRIDGPAIELADGGKVWVQNDMHHNLHGPAIDHVDGNKKWMINGKLHRLDGPAVEWNGSKEYWIDNKRILNKKIFDKIVNLKVFL